MLMLHDFRVRQRDFLLEISRAMTAQLDLGEVLKLVLNASVVMLSGEVGLIALRNVNTGRYEIRATTTGINDEQVDTLAKQLLELTADESDGLDAAQVNEKMRQMATSLHPRLKQSIALPLVMAGEPLGLLIVFRAYRGNATPDDVQVLQSFADQAAIAVYNAQLYAGIDQERRRLAAILQNSADGVMILDADQCIVSFNRALERMTAWDAEDAMALHVSNVIQWDDPDTLDIEDYIRRGWPHKDVQSQDDENDLVEPTPNGNKKSLYVEGDIVRKDGVKLSVGITYAPLLTRNGHLVNIIANVRDITNFRRAQEMQKMFVSTVSHELRTPITLIKGYAETLSREDAGWDKDAVRDGLDVIGEEADRLNALVGNLITASKLQAKNELDINLSMANLSKVAAQAVERFSKQTDDHEFKLDFPDDFPNVEADSVRVRQVIDNLLSNAIKYSPDGGLITVGGKHDDDSVMIYVRDEGVGMTETERENLFERFYRVDNMLSRKTEGTGLGLYLSQAIVKSHGGEMDVDSVPGQGSVFYFTLPR